MYPHKIASNYNKRSSGPIFCSILMMCLTDNIWKGDALGSRLRTHVSSEQEVGGGASGKEVWDVICLQVRTAPPPPHVYAPRYIVLYYVEIYCTRA